MKKIILSLVALFVFGNAFSQGIEFEHGTFSEALAKAKKENKIVFIDCYTQWCKPCKIMAKTVFTQKKVGDFFNKNFVNVKMDMETEDAMPLSKKYKISSFPTLLWLDANGNILTQSVGGMDANALMKTATLALNPETTLSGLNERFKNGERGLEFLQNYIDANGSVGNDIDEAVALYFSRKKTEDLINADDFILIMNVVKTSSDPIFHFVVKNKAKFYTVAPKSEYIDQYITGVMMTDMRELAKKGDKEALNLKKKELIALDKELGTEAAASIDMSMSK